MIYHKILFPDEKEIKELGFRLPETTRLRDSLFGVFDGGDFSVFFKS
jgi:hypothetical protein